MCDYLKSITNSLEELGQTGLAFDMVDLRAKTRELAAPLTSVTLKRCQQVAIEYFKQGNLPGMVIGLKSVTPDYPTFWNGSDFSVALRRILVFLPVAALKGECSTSTGERG